MIVGQENPTNMRFKGAQRNKPCYCGSGKKYKRCHYFADREGLINSTNTPLTPQMIDELKMATQGDQAPLPPPEDEFAIPHLSDLPPEEAEAIRNRYKKNVQEHSLGS